MDYEAHEWIELNSILGLRLDPFPWSKEDELMVLEKLLEFSTLNNNNNPKCYTTQFYNYVTKMLSVQLFENQLSYMIFRLRNQYLDGDDDDKEQEQEQDLDSHGLKVLELSRKLWKVDGGWRPKTKVVKDHLENLLGEYAAEELGFEGDRLPPSVMEEVEKDWHRFQFVEHEIRSMQNRFSLRLFQLKANMRHNSH